MPKRVVRDAGVGNDISQMCDFLAGAPLRPQPPGADEFQLPLVRFRGDAIKGTHKRFLRSCSRGGEAPWRETASAQWMTELEIIRLPVHPQAALRGVRKDQSVCCGSLPVVAPVKFP